MRWSPGLLLAAAVACASPAGAALTQYWTVESPEDFLKCAGKGVALGGERRAEAGPQADSLGGVGEPLVWAVARGPRGVIYAGTGHAGKIYRSENGAAPKPWASTGEAEVLALAADGRGGVYAGTGPKGRVFHVDAKGAVKLVCELKAEYVWALLPDSDGALFAATGATGKVFRIGSSGEAEEYWATPAGHIVCLAWSRAHTLLAGGEEDGLLYEIASRGHGRAIFDSGEKEIHAIAVTPSGEVYVSALKIALQAPGPAAGPNSPGGIVADKGNKSTVFRLLPNGAGVRVWDGPGLAYALAAWNGGVYAATGEPAQLLRLSDDGAARVLELDPGSVLCADASAEDLVLGTSTPGELYRVRAAKASGGHLDSFVLDGKRVARWGGLFPRGDALAGVRFLTRSGNSDTPDAGWSEWQRYERGNIASPPARYLQWRAELPGGASLRGVRVAWREQNLPPEVSGVKVLPSEPKALLGPPDGGMQVTQVLSGGVKVEYSLPRTSQRPSSFDVSAWARGIRHIRWDASDPNGDPLSFDLDYRAVGDRSWKPLATGLDEPVYAWDTTSLPDGPYEVRVTASDSSVNTPSEARATSRVSEPAIVDHTPPAWRGLRAEASRGGFTVTGAAHDELSPLVYLAYSLDGGNWVLVEPEDGVLDSPDESVRFDVPSPGRGEHTLVLKAVDLGGNVGSASLTLR